MVANFSSKKAEKVPKNRQKVESVDQTVANLLDYNLLSVVNIKNFDFGPKITELSAIKLPETSRNQGFSVGVMMYRYVTGLNRG